jgi:hypothetical protein
MPGVSAAYALLHELMSEEFKVCSSLTKWASTDFVGKLPEWLQVFEVLSEVYHLQLVTQNSHVVANAGAN